MIKIVVYGTPAPQGSKRAFIHKHTGKAMMAEQTAKRLKPWREAVKQAALDATRIGQPVAVGGGTLTAHQGTLADALFLRVTFTFARPKSHYRTGRNAQLLRDDAPLYPAGRPDLSKLLRSTEDALTDAGIWRDDAQVVMCTAWKRYVGESGGLDRPGAVLHIGPLDLTTDGGQP